MKKLFRDISLVMIIIGVIDSSLSFSDKFIIIGIMFGVVYMLQVMIKLTK